MRIIIRQRFWFVETVEPELKGHERSGVIQINHKLNQ